MSAYISQIKQILKEMLISVLNVFAVAQCVLDVKKHTTLLP
ncbi:MAG: hypothetical protein ACTHJ7_08805 [Candidatus Nitrosocosmicus sp.]